MFTLTTRTPFPSLLTNLNRLISCSVGTVIYYAFQCDTIARNAFLLICLLNGLGGTIVSFWDGFDRSENKVFNFAPLHVPEPDCCHVFCRNGVSLFSSLPQP